MKHFWINNLIRSLWVNNLKKQIMCNLMHIIVKTPTWKIKLRTLRLQYKIRINLNLVKRKLTEPISSRFKTVKSKHLCLILSNPRIIKMTIKITLIWFRVPYKRRALKSNIYLIQLKILANLVAQLVASVDLMIQIMRHKLVHELW